MVSGWPEPVLWVRVTLSTWSVVTVGASLKERVVVVRFGKPYS